MSSIPTEVTPEQFAQHVEPHLSKAKRGFVSKIPLSKIFNYTLHFLHTGCQWKKLPIDKDPNDPDKKELTYWAVYHHFRKWSKDGSLERVWKHSIGAIQEELDLSELNLDGTHAIAKKGGGVSSATWKRVSPKRITRAPGSVRAGRSLPSEASAAGEIATRIVESSAGVESESR